MLYCIKRLPSLLCWDAAWLAGSTEVDFVDAAEAVVNGGIAAMAFLRIDASRAGVFQVL
jgi:hypothetical protein